MDKGRLLGIVGMVVAAMFMISIGCVTTEKKQELQPVMQQPTPPPPEPKPASTPSPSPPAAEKPEPKEEAKNLPTPPEPVYIEHVVRWKGETLSLISKWYTGKFSNWKIIAEANPDLNPKRMRSGNIIRIPKELARTQEPMPKSFVDKFYKKKESEEPVLFGPKK